MFRTEHNSETGEIVQVPLTTEEVIALQTEWAREAARIADEEAALGLGVNE